MYWLYDLRPKFLIRLDLHRFLASPEPMPVAPRLPTTLVGLEPRGLPIV